jgi:hypothetical protein
LIRSVLPSGAARRHRFRPDDRSCPGPVLDYDSGLVRVSDLLRQEARQNIAGAARRERDDDLDLLRRLGCRGVGKHPGEDYRSGREQVAEEPAT